MSSANLRVAIIGATGAVGRQMIQELEKSSIFAKIDLNLYASSKSAGQEISYRQTKLRVNTFNISEFPSFDFILMSCGSQISREVAHLLKKKSSYIIDNSSAWRMDENTPLIVPEVNGHLLRNLSKGSLIANPNCAMIQLAVSLVPLEKFFGLSKVYVSTYQSVSGAGQKGIEDLSRQTKTNDAPGKPNYLPRPIAFNLIPAIDKLDPSGWCFEEIKLIQELKKVLAKPELDVFAHTIRVPVYNCHSETVTVELKKEISLEEAHHAFQSQTGLKLVQENTYDSLPTPRDCVLQRDVFVARVRIPFGEKASKTLSYWNVSDNLVKGAAWNAVQIAEELFIKKAI